jgi:hypothetical protein
MGYWWESRKQRDHLDDDDVGGWIIWILQKSWGGTDWIDLAQGRDWWRNVVNTIVNLRVP